MWPVKDKGLKRKISFIVKAPEQPYQVVSGIYNDDIKVKDLNKKLEEMLKK